MYLCILLKPPKLEKNNFSLIKQAPHSFMYIANVLIHNCNYIECIYVCLLHVVLWNKLLKLLRVLNIGNVNMAVVGHCSDGVVYACLALNMLREILALSDE